MKHQYFGDQSDYVKYGLLRCFAKAGFRVGVCWMLTPDDGGPDGRRLSYLSNAQVWRDHDPDLFDTLQDAIKNRIRNVGHIQPHIPNARFFPSIVPGSRSERVKWFCSCADNLHESDLWFFDPDNGLEVKQPYSTKHVRLEELEIAWARNKTLLIYQHHPFQPRDEYIQTQLRRLKSCLVRSYVLAFSTPHVVFFLAFKREQIMRIDEARNQVTARWSSRRRITCIAPTQ